MEQFARDVHKGLSSSSKSLLSKYFYDEIGDDLFVQIMQMPEYYLTRAEHEIFRDKTAEIVSKLNLANDTYFELIELGAGDGSKTKELLKHLISHGFQFDYRPLDISKNALNGLKSSLGKEIPTLSVQPLHGDYFEVLTSLKSSNHRKVILFLGSNIGNMLDARATEFMKQLSESLSSNDSVFLGVDVIKSKEIVLPAYNDAQGITAAFNLNLLKRINRELGGNFVVEAFEHCPEYNEIEVIAKSSLRSKKHQSVHIEAFNQDFHFAEGEKIQTEISRKYNDDVLNQILAESQFRIIGKLLDSQEYFADYVLVKD